jgi:hypothetical protein
MSYDSWLEEPYQSSLDADYERTEEEFLDKTVILESGPYEGDTGIVTDVVIEYDGSTLLTVKIPEPDELHTFYTDTVNGCSVTVLDKTT